MTRRLTFYLFLYLTFTYSSGYSQADFPADPKRAQLVTVDLLHFQEAWLKLTPDTDTLAVLRKDYFERASPGLEEYIRRHELSPELLREAIRTHPDAYRDLLKFIDQLPGLTRKYRRELQRYRRIIPDALFPPTYLLVGANRGIAQASQVGQLVTVIRNLTTPERLLNTMLHELTHFQQARILGFREYAATYTKADNMLDLILREGGADFVTYFLVNKNTALYDRLAYVEEREATLWKRFQEDLARQDQSFWLWESLNQSEVPILLGYTIGYKICAAYYQRAVDKADAVRDILGITNAADFLQKSNYQPKK